MRKNQNAELRKPEILESYYQVMIKEGIEGSSISKIAKRLDLHPSLIIHYFKNKENMKLELVELLIQKFESRHMIQIDHIKDPAERFDTLIDILFSLKWSRTVEPSVHFGFYYLSFRNEEIAQQFQTMFIWLRNYLKEQLTEFKSVGVINVQDEKKAADYIVTMMEGLEFHARFLAENQPFEEFAEATNKTVKQILKNGDI